MPSDSVHAPRTNEPSSLALGRQPGAAHRHLAAGPHVHDKSEGQSGSHVHDDTHNHSVPHNHGPRLSGWRVEVSPVLASGWARVLTALAMLGLLWLAIFWAFAGNV